MDLSKELHIIEQELFALLSILKEHITHDDEKLLREFITHSECGLAYEEIVETIRVHQIPIALTDYDNFVKVGRKLKFQEQEWEKIKHLIK